MENFHLSSRLYWLYNSKDFTQFRKPTRCKSSIHPRFERTVIRIVCRLKFFVADLHLEIQNGRNNATVTLSKLIPGVLSPATLIPPRKIL
jgi:hypothetical protein